jgi:SAM-dependent methyltransferase
MGRGRGVAVSPREAAPVVGADRRRGAGIELLDHPERLSPAELATNLRDIARLNRLGPTRGICAAVGAFVEHPAARSPLRVLDLGTGGADIPAALARRARARGHDIRVVGLDTAPEVLACARRVSADAPDVRLVLGDALRPPVRSGGVDVAVCSLLLHHLGPDQVVALLRAMADVSRLGFVVSDLRRSRLAYLGAWLVTRATSASRVTRHDGPLSVRRAYTRTELRGLAAAAGLPTIRWRHAAPFRLLGVFRRAG